MSEPETKDIEEIESLQERFRILTKLESGGMADIYLGIQLGEHAFERLVVIKKVRTRGPDAKQALGMFLDEARVIASLNHPHIVKIYDLSKVRNSICITMEYIDGENLSFLMKWLKKRDQGMPLNVAYRLIIQACEALQYAHTARSPEGNDLEIVHRDIDLRNLMLESNGYLKIIDFGVAKAATQLELTGPTMFKGKLSCIAPETFSESTIDSRADLYSLGLVFYQLITGANPFQFKPDVALGEVIYRVTNETIPPPTSIRTDLPAELDFVIAEATHKDRAKRIQTAEQFAKAIRELAETSSDGIADTDHVKNWYEREFGKRIDQRRNFEKKIMQKARDLAAAAGTPHSIPGGVIGSDGEEPILSPSVAPPPPDSVSHHPPPPRRSSPGDARISAAEITPHTTSPDSGSATSFVEPTPGQPSLHPMVSGPDTPGPANQVHSYPPVSIHTSPVNIYSVLIVFFLLFVGGALLVHQLFYAPEEETNTQPMDAAETNPNLRIVSTPSHAEVLINGNLVGTTGDNGFQIRITPDVMHRITVRKLGYEPYEAAVWGKNIGLHKTEAVLSRQKPEEEAQIDGLETKKASDDAETQLPGAAAVDQFDSPKQDIPSNAAETEPPDRTEDPTPEEAPKPAEQGSRRKSRKIGSTNNDPVEAQAKGESTPSSKTGKPHKPPPNRDKEVITPPEQKKEPPKETAKERH